jgi:hypothetical protein
MRLQKIEERFCLASLGAQVDVGNKKGSITLYASVRLPLFFA